MALVPWSPLKNGFLSGKYRRGAEVVDSARTAFVGGPSDDEFDVIDSRRRDRRRARNHLCGSGFGVAAGTATNRRADRRSPAVGAPREQPRRPRREADTEHLRVLDEVSAPTLNYPADVNGATRAMLQFAGTTVDGEAVDRVSAAAGQRHPVLVAVECRCRPDRRSADRPGARRHALPGRGTNCRSGPSFAMSVTTPNPGGEP